MPWGPNLGYLLGVLLLLVGLRDAGCSTSAPRYPVCKPGLEFWSVEHATCWPCTRCAPEFTLSPCTVYKDAICGPLSALELDLSFLSTRKRPETGQRSLEAVTSKMLWRFPDLDQQQITQQDTADNSGRDFQSKTQGQVQWRIFSILRYCWLVVSCSHQYLQQRNEALCRFKVIRSVYV